MSAETLLSAARRAVRFFNIDMNKGGIITVETQQAIETLDRMVRIEDDRARKASRGGRIGEAEAAQ